MTKATARAAGEARGFSAEQIDWLLETFSRPGHHHSTRQIDGLEEAIEKVVEGEEHDDEEDDEEEDEEDEDSAFYRPVPEDPVRISGLNLYEFLRPIFERPRLFDTF
jgi:hypothetical protein